MDLNDFDEFTIELKRVANHFREPFDTERIKTFFAALADMSLDDVRLAMKLAMRDLTFCPKPPELRRLIEGSPDDKASEAWEIANRAFHKAGAFQSVMFEDGMIGQALVTVFGSWAGFCEAMHPVYRQADEISWEDREAAKRERREPEGRMIRVGGLSDEMVASKRKEFIAAYRNAKRTGQVTSYLPGEHEIQNRASLGSWKRGQFQIEDGREVYKLPVCVAGATSLRSISASFDRQTGYLIGGSEQLLLAAPERLSLPPKPKALLSDGSEMVPPAEVKGFVAEAMSTLASSMQMPGSERKPMTDDEVAARQMELRRQFERLKNEEKAIDVTEDQEAMAETV